MALYNGKKVLGIIPARSGSKGIPHKNIKMFAGKPLMHWAIQGALESGALDRVIVSTDSEEYAKVAREGGADVPFLRPADLAQDTTPALPVLQHVLSELKEREGYVPDYAMIMEATGPGRQPAHIRGLVDLVTSTGAEAAFTVMEVPGTFHADWQLKMGEEGRVELLNGKSMKHVIRRRQDLPKLYMRGSSTYIFKPELLFATEPSFYGDDCRMLVIDSKYSVDIDDEKEWAEAESIFPTLERLK